MKYKEVAQRVLKYVGKDNIQAAAHCATRLRLVLKDDKAIDQKGLDNDPDVKGTFETDGQYQIIIGPGDVNHVYDELIKMTGLKEATTDDIKQLANKNKKVNPIAAICKLLSDIFIPIIPALVAGGLLMALNNVLTAQHLFMAKSVVQAWPQLKGTADLINTMASAPFQFLPILLGVSATKRFGGNPYLGACMGMIMVLPGLVNGYDVATTIAAGKMTYWNVFGLHVAKAGYQGQVLPVLGVSYILAKLERFLHKHLKGAVDFTFTPMIAILITGFLTFTVVGPVLRGLSDGLTNSLVWLYSTTGWIGMGIFGLFYSAIVITGLHQAFPGIETQLLANVSKTGGSFIFPVASMANVAQGGASLAVYFITKNEKTKALSSSSSLSALLGITEPAIFGVTLKLRYPFICAAIASGISSALIGAFHVLSVSMGPAGFIGFICIASKSIGWFLVCATVSFILAFVFTYSYAKGKGLFKNRSQSDVPNADEDPSQESGTVADELIAAPVSGQTEDISDVKDKVFSTKIMGKGIAIIPNSNKVIAPVSGTISVAYPTHHAYGITSDDGAEILIHLGIDTVDLKGKDFSSNVKQGEHVDAGQELGTFDYQAIQKAGYDTTVMVVITNTKAYAEVDPIYHDKLTNTDKILALTKPIDNAGIAVKLDEK